VLQDDIQVKAPNIILQHNIVTGSRSWFYYESPEEKKRKKKGTHFLGLLRGFEDKN
jgi:hypothetical protein